MAVQCSSKCVGLTQSGFPVPNTEEVFMDASRRGGHGWKDGWRGEWMDTDSWMSDRWMEGGMNRWNNGWRERQLDGWVDGYMDGWVDGWSNGRRERRMGG